MSKKKTSTQDFLNLLETEEAAVAAPKNAAIKSRARKKLAPAESTKIKILKELLTVAEKNSPKPVAELIAKWRPKFGLS